MTRPLGLPVVVAAALAFAGCADLLGVEDVEEHDGVGGGGGSGGAPPGGFGAGLPGPATSSGTEGTSATGTTSATTGETTATATTGDGASSSSTTTSSSTGGGSACGTVLPPCAAAVPSTFDSDADLDLGFDRDGDSDEVDSAGGMLELEPRDDDDEARYAAVKSKVAIGAPASGACAVWVTLVENGTDIEPSIAIGPGTPSEDAYRLERRGVVIAAQVEGVDVAQTPYVKDVTRIFRIWLDAAGQVGFDVSTDGTCWSALGNPMPQTAGGGLVRLHAEGESGKAKLDDFCL